MLLRSILTTIVCVLLASVSAGAAPTIVTAATANWQPAPPAFKGAQVAKIVGDPAKAGGYYAYLLKVPDGAVVAPHFHGMTENVTVISGILMVGLGDTVDPATMKPLPAGGIASIPAGLHHYAVAKGVTIVEISGIGPDTITFLHK
jgi:quercetin dioxygenase-like cupin family protein